jgi:hypothetical protein
VDIIDVLNVAAGGDRHEILPFATTSVMQMGRAPSRCRQCVSVEGGAGDLYFSLNRTARTRLLPDQLTLLP